MKKVAIFFDRCLFKNLSHMFIMFIIELMLWFWCTLLPHLTTIKMSLTLYQCFLLLPLYLIISSYFPVYLIFQFCNPRSKIIIYTYYLVLFLYILQVSKIICYLFFLWLISLIIIPSNSIHVALNYMILSFLMAVRYPICTFTTTLSIHLLLGFGLFPYLGLY